MTKPLLGLVAGTAFLATMGMASAAEPTAPSSPMVLSSAQMDNVTAGSRRFNIRVGNVILNVVVTNQTAVIVGPVAGDDITGRVIQKIEQRANTNITNVQLN